MPSSTSARSIRVLLGLAPSSGVAGGTGDGVRIRDHLAAVRTLLAWQRAAVTLCGVAAIVSRLRQHRLLIERISATGLVLVAVVLVLLAGLRLLTTGDELVPGAVERRPLVAALPLVLVAVAAALLTILAAQPWS
ncbi:MAG: DUF202 domain-containing protein [Chloroflexi bacterium]|nr:MAG: DUF202 domain-containing protein [Chloroflexota bacterium]